MPQRSVWSNQAPLNEPPQRNRRNVTEIFASWLYQERARAGVELDLLLRPAFTLLGAFFAERFGCFHLQPTYAGSVSITTNAQF